jgi:adenylate kinase
VVTGTPGVGKSLFSKRLASEIGATPIDVGKVALQEGFVVGTDVQRRSKIVDMKALSKWVRSLLHEVKGPVILEGHYVSAVVPNHLADLVIVLRCDPKELMKRLRRRRISRKKVYENVAAEVLDVCLVNALESFDKKKVCEIDTTRRTLNSIIREAKEVVDGRIAPTFGKVDWLSRLEKSGELDALMDLGLVSTERP